MGTGYALPFSGQCVRVRLTYEGGWDVIALLWQTFADLRDIMSEPRQNSKKKTKAKPEPSINPAVVWGVRAVISVVAAVLLGLGWHEYQVKQDFSSTNETWQKALRSKGENADLNKSEFSGLPVKGSPSVTSDKAGPNSLAAATVDTYTWKGRIRTYAVKVYFGLGNDPPVELVEVVGAEKEDVQH